MKSPLKLALLQSTLGLLTTTLFATPVFAEEPVVDPADTSPTTSPPPAPDPDSAPVPDPDRSIRDETPYLPSVNPAPEPQRTDKGRPFLATDFGMTAMIGGGVVGFTQSEANSVTDVGGSWTARLIFGTRSHIGFEAAYVGSAQSIESLNLDSGSVLLSSAAEADVRLNVLTGPWQPYLLAGIAYKHYDLVNSEFNTSDVLDSDSVGNIPLGAGLAFRWDGFVADARVAISPAFDSDLLPGVNGERADLTTWDANMRVGFEF